MNDMSAAGFQIFAIVLHNHTRVENALFAIAKRAERRGLPVPTWTWGEVTVEKETHGFRSDEDPDVIVPREVRVTRVALSLTTTPVRYAGWTFVAALSYIEGSTIIRSLPGEECPVKYRTAGSACDHCRASRNRKSTYVLRHEDGRHMQVGSTCVDAFLGGEDALDMAALAEIVSDLRRASEMGVSDMAGFGRSSVMSLTEYLTNVAVLVRVSGWISRTAAREMPGKLATADLAQDRKVLKEIVAPAMTEEDAATAASALAWAADLTDAEVNAAPGDYLHNVRAIARAGYVTPKLYGIGASIVVAHQRAIGAARLNAERVAKSAMAIHVGVVGDKVSFGLPVKMKKGTQIPLKNQPVSLSSKPVTLEFVTGYETDYGYVTIVKFRTAEGALVVWKASGADVVNRDDAGKRYTLTGTVKKHDEYKGEKQTIITRCTMIEVPASQTLLGVA